MTAEGTVLVQIPAAAVAAMHHALGITYGSADAANLLREMGLASGSSFYDLFRDWLSGTGAGDQEPEQLDSELFWKRFSGFFEELGWGALTPEHPHPGVTGLSSDNWAEAAGSPREHPGCHYSTGVIAEVLSRVAGQDLAAMEAECRAAGDERCRFLVGSPETLSALHERIRHGERFAEAITALT